MKYRFTNLLRTLAVLMVVATATFSCVEADQIDLNKIETEVFSDWMAKYHPNLLGNFQPADDGNGGYYIDIATVGDKSTRPIMDTICWIEYDLTGYDLHGNVTITRNDLTAWQQGSFSEYTHYTPYFRYSDPTVYDDEEKKSSALLECTQLAFSKPLQIGDQDDVKLYNGAEFTIYSTSSIISESGTTGTGGYEGQFSLTTLPFICKIKVTNVVINPLTNEENLVNTFAMTNGGLTVTPESFSYDPGVDGNKPSTDEEGEEDEDKENLEDYGYDDPNLWTNGTEYIPQVYVNTRYELNMNGSSVRYINPYTSNVPDSPYSNGMAELDRKINDALEIRFSNDYDFDGKLVGQEGYANVWYICRLLDGFIVDTNIDEVSELAFGDKSATGAVLNYDVDADAGSYISAWMYAIPSMRYGRWNALVTSSSFAYGTKGSNGDTTTSSSSSSNYYDYYNYYNNYSNYYGGYSNYYGYSNYNYGYGGYGYDYGYGGGASGSTNTTTTTVSTEILPYAPLIFEIFIEPDATADDEEAEEEK